MSREIVANLKFRNATNSFNADALARKIEEGYLSQRREDKHTKKVSFAPSSIGYGHGTCARYWYQAFNGADFVEKTDALGVANMSNGTAAHDRIQKVFEDAGILVAAEVETKLESPPIRGYIDALIRWEGQVIVGEFKTARQEAFLFRQSTMKPSVNHLYQLLIYLKATGKDTGFIMYENKNDQTFLILPVRWNARNEALLNDALKWLRAVYANWKRAQGTDDRIPQRPWTRRNKNCRGCPLFEKCWPVDAEGNPTNEGVALSEVVIPAMVVPKI